MDLVLYIFSYHQPILSMHTFRHCFTTSMINIYNTLLNTFVTLLNTFVTLILQFILL